MALTTEQAATFKTALFAETDQELVGYRTNGQTGMIRDWYNKPNTSGYIVWKPTTPVADIQDSVVWANYTPTNPATGTDAIALQNTIAQLMACQGKQFNLQMLLSVSGMNSAVSTGKQNIRAGLQDATSAIPSDVNLGTKTGGWQSIKAIIQRPATRIEKLFATGAGTTTNPSDIVFTGLTENDVVTALSS
jgi:hypothetical protein